ncbi:phospholipase A2 inhibitor and Ly6/PLAUR domain-containing protein-like [Pelobates fuscus]|uniref:phospholipase A2 inhibitor and Ly6/PLAUR domain-containing protein-like n=1 Tax=Pelobates fuscus TaxID=191477 RepID=UPI002FE4A2FE
MTSRVQIKRSGTSVVDMIRSCQPANKCNIMGIVANTALNIGFLVTCCSTDDCTPTIPTIPSISNAFNGLTCPSCISASSDCTSSETMLCQGEENKCVLYTTNSINGMSAIRGCSTQAPCDIGSFSATASGAFLSMSFMCNSATPETFPPIG